jgi:hypothetical protein
MRRFDRSRNEAIRYYNQSTENRRTMMALDYFPLIYESIRGLKFSMWRWAGTRIPVRATGREPFTATAGTPLRWHNQSGDSSPLVHPVAEVRGFCVRFRGSGKYVSGASARRLAELTMSVAS